MVLRDRAGVVVDSLNYGLLVDPWAAKGYQGTSGTGEGGCRVPAPGPGRGGGGFGGPGAPPLNSPDRSAGRVTDGLDTDSNCNDFALQAVTMLSAASAAGATNIKVAGVADFAAGQTILIDSGGNMQTAVIAAVGTAGATTTSAATDAGATVLNVANAVGFSAGQTITIDSGGKSETAVVASTVGGGRGGAARITVTAPLKSVHMAGTEVSGSGITLTTPLSQAHASGSLVVGSVPTPGAANNYSQR